jgi:hypothetical protein
MKRSEMVNRLIEDILTMDGFLNYSYGARMPSSYEEIAETIIDYLVSQGMRPPCCANFGEHRNLNENGDCNDYIESCNFKWELEDETK